MFSPCLSQTLLCSFQNWSLYFSFGFPCETLIHPKCSYGQRCKPRVPNDWIPSPPPYLLYLPRNTHSKSPHFPPFLDLDSTLSALATHRFPNVTSDISAPLVHKCFGGFLFPCISSNVFPARHYDLANHYSPFANLPQNFSSTHHVRSPFRSTFTSSSSTKRNALPTLSGRVLFVAARSATTANQKAQGRSPLPCQFPCIHPNLPRQTHSSTLLFNQKHIPSASNSLRILNVASDINIRQTTRGSADPRFPFISPNISLQEPLPKPNTSHHVLLLHSPLLIPSSSQTKIPSLCIRRGLAGGRA